MKDFANLYEELDSTTSTNEKMTALKNYFQKSDVKNAIWAVMILTERIKKKFITSKNISDFFLSGTQYPEWLYKECYHNVGDTAETVSLLCHSLEICQPDYQESFHHNLNKPTQTPLDTSAKAALHAESDVPLNHKPLYEWMESDIPSLSKMTFERQVEEVMGWWKELNSQEIFILNKLMTGALRVGVSEKLVVRALAEVYNLPTDVVAHRISGKLHATPEAFLNLISQDQTHSTWSQPYPFCLANSWTDRSEKGFDPKRWCIEWKFDGIRMQAIKRDKNMMLWSRGEESINDSFPEIVDYLQGLPDGTVLDGEILVIQNGQIKEFNDLQKRLGRKKVSSTHLKEYPAGLIAYDCLECEGQDIRQKPLKERKEILKAIIEPLSLKSSKRIRISETFTAKNADDLEHLRALAREKDAEGLMLKDWNSSYTVGRKVGSWWKHKVDPLTLDAVLLYAQAGTGKRSNLHTDYTFALWRENELVPFAKAYSGLDHAEIDELDSWIRRHTKEKFGPVRSVEPFHVFEIAFEGISESGRHKSGIAVRFPRIKRWRKDKLAKDADTLATAFELLGTKKATNPQIEFPKEELTL